ncbi:AAA family ATPase [Stigmatella hybrida]|uniref:AAA family ATPase n=1 Tax=Stigmatella hybrida TaxID=394097 RepID=UPI001CDAD32C|nr:AAA family ATPase [Stigmatella hybrida]
MGRIFDELEPVLTLNPSLRMMLRAFLHGFDVTWGSSERLFGSHVVMFFLKPEAFVRERFGMDREILLVYSEYNSIEPRILQIASALMSRTPAAGRVEPLMYFLVSPAPELVETVGRLMAENSQSRVAVPLPEQECREAGDLTLVQTAVQRHLFSRDLFDIEQPITNDLFFFGRTGLVFELRDAALRGENVGLFGLRKVGKTSVLLRLQRLLEEEQSGKVVYVDLQDAALYSLSWWELLDEIRKQLPYIPVKPSGGVKRAAKLFRTAVEEIKKVAPDKHVIIAVDEVEHITPNLRMRQHWDQDFLDFWKTLRAVQNVNRHISLIVAGVNASAIETPMYGEHDNPLFSLARTRYVPIFSREELRQMVRTLGAYMGLRFEEAAFDQLRAMYGGHPLLTRLACSFMHKKLLSEGVALPALVTVGMVERTTEARDKSLFPFGSHILGMLQRWYKTEYQLLEQLAQGNAGFFNELINEVPQYGEHLKSYQLVAGEPPELTIPFLAKYLRSQTRMQKDVVLQAAPVAAAPESSLLEISALRNRLEPKLRKLVKRVLKAHLGAERWIDPVLDSIPSEQRKTFQGVDKNEILEKRIFLLNLITVVSVQWEKFKHFEAAPPERKVSREQFKVLLDYVNAHREDAHAKPVSQAELAALRVVVNAIETAVDRLLED